MRVPAASPSPAETSATVRVRWSSSTMVASPAARAMVASTGLVSARLKVSSGSSTLSPTTFGLGLTSLASSPGLKVTVPLAGAKSSGAIAVPAAVA
jgi:hypothetical protein